MDTLEAIMTRRSTRKMRPEMPERHLIETVIEAGRAAPSGSNSRKTRFLVITRPDILEKLRELVRNEFAAMEIREDTYISLKNSIHASKTGTYVYDYGAPVLILTANKTDYGNAMADSACALENMMIAANALNLGSCWINQLHWLTDHAPIRETLLNLGMEADEFVTGGLILGYGPDGQPVREKRNQSGNPVVWIE